MLGAPKKKGALHSHSEQGITTYPQKEYEEAPKVFLHAFLFAMSFDVVILL
jgi:hypothetical protein